jgi:N-acetylneuraminic acid mutarotase
MGTWRNVSEEGGDPRPASKDAMALAGLGGKLFVGGGFGTSNYELSSFDPQTISWTTLPSFAGKGRDRHGMVSLEDGNLYIFGGRDSNGTLFLA